MNLNLWGNPFVQWEKSSATKFSNLVSNRQLWWDTWLIGKILLTKFAKHRKLKMISGHPNHPYKSLTLYLCVYSLGRITESSAPVKFSTVASGIWEWIISEIFSTSQCDSFSMTMRYPAPERNHLKDHMKHFHTF